MIELLISSSALVLGLLLIRVVFLGKINPVVQYGLWSLVVLHLLPFRMLLPKRPESRLSVIHVVETIVERLSAPKVTVQLVTAMPKSEVVHNTVFAERNSNMVNADYGIASLTFTNWALIVTVVWVIGALGFGMWFLYINQDFKKQIISQRTFLMSIDLEKEKASRHRAALKGRREARKKSCLPVYCAGKIDSPCLLWHKGGAAIYVNSEIVSDSKKMKYAIAHEVCHYRHRDLLWSMIRILVLTVYWFHPFVWVAAVMSKRDCELACDYKVVYKMNRADRMEYGTALLEMLSSRKKKEPVIQAAATMQGSARGMKERLNMIAKETKMKASTLLIVLFIATVSAGFTFTSAPEYVKEIGGQEAQAFNDFTVKWADAFSERDAKSIYEMCENEELFLTIGEHTQGGGYWMGVSSPWPWNKDYVIERINDSTADIYYYYRTSSPTVFVAKETITVNKDKSGYKVSKDNWKYFDEISSKAEFEEAYQFGVPELIEFAAAYQFQADDNSDYNEGRKEILENPVTAAKDQLNLAGANVTGIYTDPYVKKAVVKFAWEDGEVSVNLSQPILIDEDDASVKRQATVWVVVNETLTGGFRKMTE